MRSDIEHIDPLEKRSGFVMIASNCIYDGAGTSHA